jgi:hypothetical protein
MIIPLLFTMGLVGIMWSLLRGTLFEMIQLIPSRPLMELLGELLVGL